MFGHRRRHSGYDIPRFWKTRSACKFEVVSGYPGGADQELAIERGEVDCRSFTITTFFSREPFPTWRKKNFVRVVIRWNASAIPNSQDVPTFRK